ncbi:MAG TPA: ribonuclease D [Nitrospirales bacterium]|nr:ribonuclease D [Nitrospirales bacterium]
MSDIHYITTETAFRELTARMENSERVGLDTEFVGEDSFVPRLEVIQVAVGDHCAVIDYPAIGTLEPWAELLSNPKIEKVVHAGRQDLELFYAHTGRVTRPVFDTQVAAAMVGYGTQVAYAQLVQRVTGVKLAKLHTFTNWSQRPLTRDQLAYAIDDVKYLLQVRDHLSKRLQSHGRLDWVREEFARLESKVTDPSREPRERYQRIKGWENMKPRVAAVLRELVAWREEEARRRNVPRGRVVRDEVLVELARQAPRTVDALRGTRGLHGSEIDRNGEHMIKAVESALALPESDWPDVAPARKPDVDPGGQVDLLQAVLKMLAQQEAIAPGLLANAADLHALVEAGRQRDGLDLPILQGWRRKLAGDLLLDVLDGKLAVRFSEKGKLGLVRTAAG